MNHRPDDLVEIIASEMFSAYFKPAPEEIVIQLTVDAEIFASDQDVDRIKGAEYQC